MTSSAKALGRLVGLHRYPVKSLVGEDLDRVFVDERGLSGDRLWSVRDPDGKLGSGKSSRRFRRMEGLMLLAARYDEDIPVVAFPDGRSIPGDDPCIHEALSTYVGRPVRLAREEDVSHFDEGPIHLVTTSTLRAVEGAHGRQVDPRRLRANLVLATEEPGFVEDAWVGHRIAVGEDLVLAVRYAMPRCVMLNQPQVDLPGDPDLLHTVAQVNDTNLGIFAEVATPGWVAPGDEARLLD